MSKGAPWEDQEIPIDPVLELKEKIANAKFEVRQKELHLNELEKELADHNMRSFMTEYLALVAKYRLKVSASSRDGDAELFIEDVAVTTDINEKDVMEDYS